MKRKLMGRVWMRKRWIIAAVLLCAALLWGCGGSTQEAQEQAPAESTEKDGGAPAESAEAPELEDGTYFAEFQTDNSMFHVSEACEGRGTLTVKNGEMTIHISLGSKNIVNLYPGLAEDAAKEGAELLEPTEDTVTYSDGMTEEVYGFDVPVPYLDREFDLALIGTKGKWYDHKVSVSDPVPAEGDAKDGSVEDSADAAQTGDGDDPTADAQEEVAGDPWENAQANAAEAFADGDYSAELDFEGGSGKAKILSPAEVTVKDQKAVATVQWSSPNYDYMIVDGEKYLPVSTEGGSVFEIPVAGFDEPMDIIGDTVAMSRPHEVEYTITFHSDTMKKEK